MNCKEKFVPTLLIIKLGNRLEELDDLGHRQYKTRYLEQNHLSGRAQRHFHLHESVSVLQLYAAIRILLINAASDWERILLMCSILNLLEQCFAQTFSVTTHPFVGGMERCVRQKMLSVAGYDFEGVIKDIGKWRRR